MSLKTLRILCFFAVVFFANAGSAFDGGNEIFLTVPAGEPIGWKTFEIITAKDTLGALAVEGFTWAGKFNKWDGVGAYRHDNSTLRIFVNHETGADATFTRVYLNVANLKSWIASRVANNTNSSQVEPAGAVLEAVSRGWLSEDAAATDPINNPCSGNVWLADTFGAGQGFAEGLYLRPPRSRMMGISG